VKSIVKKVFIYSMVGIMQLGIGASVIEASPKHYDNQHDQRYKAHYKSRDQRIREERQRYECEIQRRHYENEREWRERQQREKEHHEEIMRTLGGLAILAIILDNN
jgi:hypothetical protein